MPPGKIIMLQGPSSAGKSTFAKAMQRSLDEYWWRLEADDITKMTPTWQENTFWEPTSDEKPHPSWSAESRLAQWLAIYWQCIAATSKTGSNVIAVGGWLQSDWLYQLATAVDGLDAYCVGVYCPLDELLRREKERGDRWVGYAESHYDEVHRHAPYDAAFDSSIQTTEQSIQIIKDMLDSAPSVPFFDRIRSEDGYKDWEQTMIAP